MNEPIELPAVKETTSGDAETDALFEEAVNIAVRRIVPILSEFLKQEVLRRMEVADNEKFNPQPTEKE